MMILVVLCLQVLSLTTFTPRDVDSDASTASRPDHSLIWVLDFGVLLGSRSNFPQ